MSRKSVPTKQSQNAWMIILAVVVVVVFAIGGILLAGAASPTRAEGLVFQANTLEEWTGCMAGLCSPLGDSRIVRWRAPDDLPVPPINIELSAENTGSSDSAFGFWLNDSGRTFYTLVNRQGYMSTNWNIAPEWALFQHVKSEGENQLSLHVDADGTAIVRINDEISWQGILTPSVELLANNGDLALSALDDNGTSWGVAIYDQGEINWHSIEVYAEPMS